MDISQNNFLYIRVECFRGQKQAKKKKKPALKKLLISQEMELSSPRAKTVMFSFISGGNSQSCLTNKNEKFLMFI